MNPLLLPAFNALFPSQHHVDQYHGEQQREDDACKRVGHHVQPPAHETANRYSSGSSFCLAMNISAHLSDSLNCAFAHGSFRLPAQLSDLRVR
jgi:hypothetical protein